MRRVLRPFEYFEPRTAEEAVQILFSCGNKAKVLAGGTDLIVSMKKEECSPQCIVCIDGISELDYIRYGQDEGLSIGPLATHAAIARSLIVRERFALLATSCNKVGSPQIRNMGTIGGNICQAGPSQDTPPVLLVLDAELELTSAKGKRSVPIEQFFIGPFQTAIRERELLTKIQVPNLPANSAGCYVWNPKITTVDETLVGVAVLLTLDSRGERCIEIKIGLCSVAPIPIRARRGEELLRGKKIEDRLIEDVAQAAAAETKPRSRDDYRRRMTKLLVKQAIYEVLQQLIPK